MTPPSTMKSSFHLKHIWAVRARAGDWQLESLLRRDKPQWDWKERFFHSTRLSPDCTVIQQFSMSMLHLYCDSLSSYQSGRVSPSSLYPTQCIAQCLISNWCWFGEKVDRMEHVTHFSLLNLHGVKENVGKLSQFRLQGICVFNIIILMTF